MFISGETPAIAIEVGLNKKSSVGIDISISRFESKVLMIVYPFKSIFKLGITII